MSNRIVIVGGGYAGLMAALRLAGKNKRQPVEITLVNAAETFIERPLLHQYATHQALKVRPIRQMLRGTNVRFVQGWVTALHPETREVEIDGGQRLGYDTLVMALGSHVEQSRVAGAEQFTDALNADGGAERLREHLDTLPKSAARVLVVGGGATGVEASAEIKGFNPAWQVGVVTDGEFGAFQGKRLQKHMVQALRQQDITVYEHTRVKEVREKELVLENGDQMPFDLCLWAGGFAASPLARAAGLQVNERGQILVDPFLRSVSHPEIYAIGDAAQPIYQPGAAVRMSVFPALVMGAQVADNLTAALQSRAQKPLSFSWGGQAIALGPHDAVGFMTYPDDKPIGPFYRGMLAVKVRALFVNFIMLVLEMERRIPGFFYWPGKGRFKMDAQPVAARPAAQSSG